MSFKDIKSLKKAILDKAKKGMEEEVLPEVKKKMLISIEEEVYLKYYPKYYSRREEDGGLSDSRNIIGIPTEERRDSFKYKIRNITMPENPYLDYYLAPLIIMGQRRAENAGYPILYTKYLLPSGYVTDPLDYYYSEPRDFITPTKERLDKGKLSSKLEKYMNS